MIMRIDTFVESARTIDPTNDAGVRSTCVAEIQWLIEQNGNKLTVQKKVLPLYKQALRDAGLVRGKYFKDHGEWWLKYLSVDVVDAEFMQGYQNNYNRQRTERLEGNRYQMHENVARDVIGLGMALISQTSSLYDTIVGLAVLSGRRDAELGLTACFAPCPDDAVQVDFSGQLKGGVEKRAVRFRIPIFGAREQVCDALARVRAHAPWRQYTPQRFDASVGADVRKSAKKHFTPLFPQCELALSSHALRKVYAGMAEHFCDLRGWTSDVYIARIMGHAPNDALTVRSYEYFQVVS